MIAKLAMQSCLGLATIFCHPKYSILYGALMLFTVGSGQESRVSSSLVTGVTFFMLFVGSC